MRLTRTLFAGLLMTGVTLGALPPAAAGVVRYVDPGGSDGAAGTAGAPWRTLQHAVDSVGPGDTVIVKPGTYAGMRIETSGAPGNWIRLEAENPGTVVVDRPGPNNKHGSNVEIETWDGDGTVAYWIVSGLEVTAAPNWGIDTRGNDASHSHHIMLRDNNVHHNGVASVKTGIFFAFTDDVKLIGNDSHHNGEHGIYLSNSGDRFVVRRNHLHHNQRCGLHMNGDLSQGGDGLISDGLIETNRINGNGSEGCAGINMDGVTDTVIRNNVIVDNHASGIAIFNQDGAQCSRRNDVLHNTIVQADDGRWAVVIGGAGCIDNTLRNNVLLTRHSFRGAIEMPTANVPGLDSDYNIVADRFTVDDGSSIIDLAGWRAATGQDAHSLVATIDATFLAGTFRHDPNGPAEDSGAAAGVPRGFAGAHRPSGGGPDIGAYETPYCDGNRATLIGTRAGDTLDATAGPDVVAGLGGGDTIRGLAGPDTICGGKGADTIWGNAGKDGLFGGDGPDTLNGNRNADTIRGGAGDDTADGGRGTDDCKAESQTHCE